MNAVFKLMLFSIVLNFATGIMINAIVDSDGEPVFGTTQRFKLSYNESYSTNFVSGLNATIDPGYGIQEQGDWFDRILDKIGLGIVRKILNTVDSYMWGFINVLKNMFGGYLEQGVSDVLFFAMKAMITVGYILGAIWLWTGKSITK